jgi:hypothetical protein
MLISLYRFFFIYLLRLSFIWSSLALSFPHFSSFTKLCLIQYWKFKIILTGETNEWTNEQRQTKQTNISPFWNSININFCGMFIFNYCTVVVLKYFCGLFLGESVATFMYTEFTINLYPTGGRVLKFSAWLMKNILCGQKKTKIIK